MMDETVMLKTANIMMETTKKIIKVADEAGLDRDELLDQVAYTFAGVVSTSSFSDYKWEEENDLLEAYVATGLTPQEVEELKSRMEGLEK